MVGVQLLPPFLSHIVSQREITCDLKKRTKKNSNFRSERDADPGLVLGSMLLEDTTKVYEDC